LISRLRARVRSGSESGYTLIESMIALMLLSVVIAAAFGVVSSMQRESTFTTNRFTAEGEAQTIADRITKDLRSAVTTSATGAAFASADVYDTTFYANLADPTGPTKLHAYLTIQPGTNVYLFHEDATPPDPGGSTGNYTYLVNPAATRIDGQYIDTSQPIFSYYDTSGNAIPTPVATASLKSIDSVGINLRVRVTPTAPIVVINTVVHIRNTDYNPNT
jgi:prepilin-type N-terminal cleavage/methylation domain-containing protein